MTPTVTWPPSISPEFGAPAYLRRRRRHQPEPHRARRRFRSGIRVGCYSRARYYQPTLQRFVSEDPIRFRTGDFNLYGYVGNNPLRFVDPLGLWYIDFGLNFPPIPGFPPGSGFSLDIQVSRNCLNIVPGLYVGLPGAQVMVVSGEPTPGFQSSASGGLKGIAGTVTLVDGKVSSFGLGAGTPGGAIEVGQWGFPIVKRPPCVPEAPAGSKSAR